MTKHKHLTLSDRNDIQLVLDRMETFKTIGQKMGKTPTTVSKEVKRNRLIRDTTRKGGDCQLLQKVQEKYEQILVETIEGTPLNKDTF